MTTALDPDRYARARALFHRAADLCGAERAALLSEECADDPALRRTVEELLAAADGGELLGDPEALRARLLEGSGPFEVAAPERIGPYRILGRIGAGGMGQVFEAEQDQPRRRVALKVIYPEWVSPRRAQRFDDEVEILGRLRHENIARAYDSGLVQTPGGPVRYVVMERVEGRPLNEWAARERPPVRERLRVFLGICRGVAEAHRRGVIHRDLKPANVLVEAGGTPKVLDFGVARLLEGDVARDDARTRPGELLGTLQYMAPEQLAGDPDAVDTRADVYALGVVLFELLSGSLPREVDSTTIPGAVARLAHMPPRRLAQLAPHLVSRLDRDLETITARALEADPEERYQTVQELAADVRAFLERRPIQARPPTLWRRLRLFALRERRTFAALALAAALAVAAVLLVLRFALRAEDARAEAVAAGEAARQETYRAQIAAASAALQAFDPAGARRYLGDAEPALRGWEWEHLATRLDGSRMVLRGHANQVWDAAFAPDGTRVYTVGGALLDPPHEQALRAWDVATGAELWAATDSFDELLSVAVHPGGELVVTGGGDGEPSLRVWRATDGELVHMIPGLSELGHQGRVEALAFVDGGARLLSASTDGTLRLWRATAHGPIWPERVLLRGAGTLRAMEVAGGWVFALAEQGPLYVLDADGFVGEARLERAGTALAAAPDGATLAVGREDGLIELLQWAGEPRTLARLDLGCHVSGLAFSTDGARLLASGRDGVARTWEVASGRELRALVGHEAGLHAVRTSPDGAWIVTTSYDRTARLWRTDAGPPGLRQVAGVRGGVRGMDADPDGALYALALFFGEVQVRRAADDVLERSIRVASRALHAVALDAARGLVAFDEGADVRVVALRDGATVRVLRGHADRVHALALERTRGLLASAGSDGEVRVWDLASGELRAAYSHPSAGGAPLWDVAWSPDGSLLASGDGDGGVLLSRPGTDVEPRVLRAAGGVRVLAWEPSGARLLAVDLSGTLSTWDPESGALLGRTTPGLRALATADPTADGRRLLLVSDARALLVWDLEHDTELARLRDVPTDPWCAGWTPDGRDLLIGHQAGLTRLTTGPTPPRR